MLAVSVQNVLDGITYTIFGSENNKRSRR